MSRDNYFRVESQFLKRKRKLSKNLVNYLTNIRTPMHHTVFEYIIKGGGVFQIFSNKTDSEQLSYSRLCLHKLSQLKI